LKFPGHPRGVVGWDPPKATGGADEPRMHGRVDLSEALRVSAWALDLFEQSLELPEAPLFSGGTFDAWPAKAVDALAVCRRELAAVRACEARERAREKARGSRG
jgi:hypothetical protein